MLIYLHHAIERHRIGGWFNTEWDLLAAIQEDVMLRVRPKTMKVAVIVAGLLPVMWRVHCEPTENEDARKASKERNSTLK
jgi:Cu/Ag efflux pump CusA